MAYKQHSAAKQYKAHRTEYCSTLPVPPEQKIACEEERASAKDYLPWGYVLFGWPEGITAWAIIFTLGAIVWQAWETRKAANASLTQVSHAVTAERAWLIIEPIDKTVAQAGYGFYWRVKNVGRTPAKLIATQARCEVSRLPIAIAPVPQYDPPIKYEDRLIPPGESVEFRGDWELKHNGTFSNYRGEFLNLNGLSLLAYGYAKYDSFGEVRESNFCSGSDGFVITQFRPRLDAPPPYTRHT